MTMHPGIVSWWHAQRARASEMASCGPAHGYGGDYGHWGYGPASCGPGDNRCGPGGGGGYEGEGGGGGGFDDGGGGFGVRRPLRFLVYKLGLDEQQVSELARILNELKTERAQAEVDRRRSIAAFADAVAGETFNPGKAGEGGTLRVESAARLRDAVVKALQQIHAILDPEQRKRLAYLIRTGTLVV
jgi:Spy/CpxP family protein refolding chaperone